MLISPPRGRQTASTTIPNAALAIDTTHQMRIVRKKLFMCLTDIKRCVLQPIPFHGIDFISEKSFCLVFFA
jgi:hypothetical protein